MGTVKKSSAPPFAKGGSTKMHKGMSAGPQKAGQSASAGKGGGKFAAGGKTKMFGKQSAGPMPSGRTGK